MTSNFNPLTYGVIKSAPSLSPDLLALIKSQRPKQSPRATIQGYTDAELTAIFSLPMFAVPSTYGRKQWAPLVALFTGMRASELAALSTGDIQQIEGVWAFHVPATKTPRRRYIPVHKRLINLGFLRFVEGQQGDGRLFGWDSAAAVIRACASLYREAVGEPDAGYAYGRYRYTLLTRLGRTPVTEAIMGHIGTEDAEIILAQPQADMLRILSSTLNCIEFVSEGLLGPV